MLPTQGAAVPPMPGETLATAGQTAEGHSGPSASDDLRQVMSPSDTLVSASSTVAAHSVPVQEQTLARKRHRVLSSPPERQSPTKEDLQRQLLAQEARFKAEAQELASKTKQVLSDQHDAFKSTAAHYESEAREIRDVEVAQASADATRRVANMLAFKHTSEYHLYR